MRPVGALPPASVLVTGAAGHLGREIVVRLRARGVRVRGLVRREPGAAPPLGVAWAVGDLTDRAAVRAALAGVDAVLLIWPLPETGEPADALVAELAAFAPRVVQVSSTAVDDTALRQSDPIVQVHADMETLLREAGVRPVVLRSDTLASNALGWAGQLRAGDVVAGPETARTAVVDERDVADAAVSALLAEDGRLTCGPHLLTGPQVLERADQVALLGTALGRRLRFEPVPAELAAARMRADGRPERLVSALVEAALGRRGSDLVTDHVRRLVGRPAGGFGAWALDHAACFPPVRRG
ncbi:NAD(P)H azoreductase [Streptomyces sp. YIM 130001]|nr:NAD(P)H azoreductase [Streptomyces sp. YIM 130001]